MNELCKVLIVDDEYIMRQGIKHLVNWDEEGFLIVGEASNGQEVLTLIAEKKPHIVLLDVVMPIIDGVELTKIIHEKYPEIKIIVLSGFDKFEYVKETLKNGAEDYILKPMLSPDTFLEVIKKVAKGIKGFHYSGEKNINLNHQMERYMSKVDEQISLEKFPEFTQKDAYRIFAMNLDYSYGNDNTAISEVTRTISE